MHFYTSQYFSFSPADVLVYVLEESSWRVILGVVSRFLPALAGPCLVSPGLGDSFSFLLLLSPPSKIHKSPCGSRLGLFFAAAAVALYFLLLFLLFFSSSLSLSLLYSDIRITTTMHLDRWKNRFLIRCVGKKTYKKEVDIARQHALLSNLRLEELLLRYSICGREKSLKEQD